MCPSRTRSNQLVADSSQHVPRFPSVGCLLLHRRRHCRRRRQGQLGLAWAAKHASTSHTARPCRTDGTTTAAVVIASARDHATAIGLSRSPLSDAVASQMYQRLALASPTARPRRQRDSPRLCLSMHALLRWRLRSSSRKSSCPVLVPQLARRQQASAAGAPDWHHSSAEAEAAALAAVAAAAARRRASRCRRRAS